MATKNEILADLKRVQSEQGKVTRFIYRQYGVHSERQVEKHFGNFKNAVLAVDGNLTGEGTLSQVEIVAPTVRKLKETVEVVGDKMSFVIPETRIDTLEKLVAHFEVDMGIWTVERFTANKWEMGFKDNDGNADVIPLYQVKATFVKNKAIVDARVEIEKLKDEAKKVARIPEPIVHSRKESGNLLELMLPDLHAGKLAWSKETGYQDYDTHLAVAAYRRAIDNLLYRASSFSFDKIILGVGNDLLQSDNIQGTTYSGTKIDVDSRYRKVYVTVRKMLAETIEKLRKIAPVEVKLVPGNHDTLSTFTMGDSLECLFHNYSDVVIDNAPVKHKTVEWGKCFLLLTHGHEGKQEDYGIWMASRYPVEFGRTKYREIHVGHKHKSAVNEKFGVKVRTLSALCPPDAWHADNNFVGNLRSAEGLVWNKDQGLVAQFYYTESE